MLQNAFLFFLNGNSVIFMILISFLSGNSGFNSLYYIFSNQTIVHIEELKKKEYQLVYEIPLLLI